ncbi:exonuclease domain-containing protein [Paraglaciecola sp. 2405UD69-4]|uniref:exonuclease domain-containing protein n=1 Tax=Paraglaciecola sp. 2405UD69-4 TaxID=3391836 RepID=UPI0039C99999
MLFNCLFGYEAQRKRLLKKVPKGALHDFLSVPFPDEHTRLSELPILSVDFETTGLNALTDKLLSVGFVSIDKQKIKLGSSYHQIINTKQNLEADNVVIHQITDQQKSAGKPLQEVIEALLQALAGRVMLVHFARIEKQFLKQACIELYGVSPPFMMLDTLALAKRKLDQRDIAYDPQELRLSALRKKHGLPNHFAHNALNDAIATAELLLAQQKYGEKKLKELM